MTEPDETGTGDTVEDLLANCLQHAQSEWKSMVDQLCADSPEHAEEVRNRVAALERCGLLSKDGLARTQQGSGTPLSLSDSSEQLGRYRILKELGRGGQAVVYLAEDARLNRRVALKVLSGANEISDRALERFRREAHAVSRLDHPGICAVYEAETIDGTPTIAMRHIDGHSLREDITTIYSTLDPSLQTSEGDDFIDFNECSYNFNIDGTYEVQDLGGNSNGSILTTGVWGLDVTNNSYTIYLFADDSQYNDTWLISDCDEDELTIESIDYPQANIYSINCD